MMIVVGIIRIIIILLYYRDTRIRIIIQESYGGAPAISPLSLLLVLLSQTYGGGTAYFVLDYIKGRESYQTAVFIIIRWYIYIHTMRVCAGEHILVVYICLPRCEHAIRVQQYCCTRIGNSFLLPHACMQVTALGACVNEMSCPSLFILHNKRVVKQGPTMRLLVGLLLPSLRNKQLKGRNTYHYFQYRAV